MQKIFDTQKAVDQAYLAEFRHLVNLLLHAAYRRVYPHSGHHQLEDAPNSLHFYNINDAQWKYSG